MFEFIEKGELSVIKTKLNEYHKQGFTQFKKALLERNNQGQTLLHVAAFQGRMDIINVLLAFNQISLFVKDQHQKTAAMLAEEQGHEEIAALLRVNALWEEKSAGKRFRLDKLLTLLAPAVQAAEVGQDKKLVLLVGPSGSGKSTLLNYLTGCRYRIEDVGDEEKADLVVNLIIGEEIAKVGHGVTSKTLYPQVVDSKLGYAYSDLAGLFDNREPEVKVCAASASELLKSMSRGIQAVLVVVEHGSFNVERGESLKKLSYALKQILGEHFKALLSSVFLVVTKSEEARPKVTAKRIATKINQFLGIEGIDPQTKDLLLAEEGLIPRYEQNLLLPDEIDYMDFLLAMSNHIAEKGAENRIIISNITDNGKTADLIQDLIEQADLQEKNQFNFMQSDPMLLEFKALLMEVIHECVKWQNQREEIQAAIQTETTQQAQNNAALQTLKSEIQQKTDELKKPNSEKAGLEAKLAEIQKQYNEKDQSFMRLKFKERELEREHDSLSSTLHSQMERLVAYSSDNSESLLLTDTWTHTAETTFNRYQGTQPVPGKSEYSYKKEFGFNFPIVRAKPMSFKKDGHLFCPGEGRIPWYYHETRFINPTLVDNKYSVNIEYERGYHAEVKIEFYTYKKYNSYVDIAPLEKAKFETQAKLNDLEAKMKIHSTDRKNMETDIQALRLQQFNLEKTLNEDNTRTQIRDQLFKNEIESASKSIQTLQEKLEKSKALVATLERQLKQLSSNLKVSQRLKASILAVAKVLGFSQVEEIEADKEKFFLKGKLTNNHYVTSKPHEMLSTSKLSFHAASSLSSPDAYPNQVENGKPEEKSTDPRSPL